MRKSSFDLCLIKVFFLSSFVFPLLAYADNQPVVWLTDQEARLDKIIPERVVSASFKLQNVSKSPVVLIYSDIAPECRMDEEGDLVLPGEQKDIVLFCSFSKSEHGFRSVSARMIVQSLGKQYTYKLVMSGQVTTSGTFQKYADKTYRKYDNTMTVHIRRPPTNINWGGKARDVLLGLANNRYFQSYRSNMPIGHVTIELNCTDTRKNKIRRIGGQSIQKISEFSKKILDEGYGFSILVQPKNRKGKLSDYPLVTVDGRFESESDVEENNDKGIWEKDLMGFSTYLIKPEECKSMVDYFDRYVSETKKYKNRGANRYGFGVDPEKLEGAGCATFVEEFFKRSGIRFYPESYYQTVNIPLKLFGDPEKNIVVDMADILFSQETLDRPTQDSVQITFPDPNVLYNTVKDANTKINKGFTHGMKIIEKGNFGNSYAMYSVFDTRECTKNYCM